MRTSAKNGAPRETVEPQRHDRSRARTVLAAGFSILLCFWIYFLIVAGTREIRTQHGPNGATLGNDFAMFYSAAVVLRHGGNPYDHRQLYRAEAQLMARDHREILQGKERELIRVGNPPLFFWALGPITSLPFPVAAYIWVAAMYVFTTLSFICTATWLGWKQIAIPLGIFLVTPQVVSATILGNVTALVAMAFSVSLLLLRRYPLLAGCLMSLAWLKPQVALPLVALVILFQASAPLRTLAGAIAGTLIQVLVTAPTSGLPSLTRWARALGGYRATISIHPDIASLSGAYYRWASRGLSTEIEALTLALAAAITVWWWWRVRNERPVKLIASAWLWGVWFLATPYAHLEDQMFLLAPVLALLGTNASRIFERKQVIVLALLFFSVLFSVASPGSIQLLWLPVLGITVCLALAAREASYPAVSTNPEYSLLT